MFNACRIGLLESLRLFAIKQKLYATYYTVLLDRNSKVSQIRGQGQWRTEGGGQGGGGHGSRAQALEGAPSQLVGAKIIRPRQIKRKLGLGK